MLVPLKLAVVVVVTLAAPATVSVIAPADTKTRLLAVLVPLRLVALFSLIETAPVVLNVRLPKLIVSVASVPSVTLPDPVLKLALPVTPRLAALAPTVLVTVMLVPPVACTVRLANEVFAWRKFTASPVAPACPSMISPALKVASIASTVKSPLSAPMLIVNVPVGVENSVVSKVGTAASLRICEAVPAASSRTPKSAVPGRLNTKFVIVLPDMSTGSKPS